MSTGRLRQPLEQMSDSPQDLAPPAEALAPQEQPLDDAIAGVRIERGLRRTLYLVGGGIIAGRAISLTQPLGSQSR